MSVIPKFMNIPAIKRIHL